MAPAIVTPTNLVIGNTDDVAALLAPLTLASVVNAWRWDTTTVAVAVAAGIGVVLAHRRRREGNGGGREQLWLAVALIGWLLCGVGVLGVYSDTVFWVRALQSLLLLYVVPFALVAARPVAMLSAAVGERGRQRLDRVLGSAFAQAATHPFVIAVAIVATPWLVFLTPWYEVVLRHGWADAVTRLALVVIGFAYFYSRWQVDLVPRRYSQVFSLLITVFESLADGIVGLVLWFGPLVASAYYQQLGRAWGPDLRLDQTIGAGVLWILGDVLGLPYLLVLLRAFHREERQRAALEDAALEAADRVGVAGTAAAKHVVAQDDAPLSDRVAAADREAADRVAADRVAAPGRGLWWESDPQLRQRFQR